MLVGMCLLSMVDGWVGKRMNRDIMSPCNMSTKPRFYGRNITMNSTVNRTRAKSKFRSSSCILLLVREHSIFRYDHTLELKR